MSPDAVGPTAAPAIRPEPTPDRAARERALRAVSVDFEAVFLAQMLTYAGVGKAPEGFDGGAGEDAFAGHLVAAQAKLLAEKGGIGLADRLFESLVRREGLK